MKPNFVNTELESVVFHQDSETYRGEYDQDTTSASTAVLALLSGVTGRDPTELDPLYATLDPEALDDLVRARSTRNGDISITFTVGTHAITVYSYGVVAVDPSGGERADDQNERSIPT